MELLNPVPLHYNWDLSVIGEEQDSSGAREAASGEVCRSNPWIFGYFCGSGTTQPTYIIFLKP